MRDFYSVLATIQILVIRSAKCTLGITLEVNLKVPVVIQLVFAEVTCPLEHVAQREPQKLTAQKTCCVV